MKHNRGPVAPHLKLICRSIARELELLEAQPTSGPTPRELLRKKHQELLKELRLQMDEFAE